MGINIPVGADDSCLTALDSAMFSRKVGAKTATDMAQKLGSDARCVARCAQRTKREKSDVEREE